MLDTLKSHTHLEEGQKVIFGDGALLAPGA